MKKLILKLLAMIYLEDLAKAIFQFIKIAKRKITGVDRRIIDEYLNNYRIRKLNIGCGENTLQGWLNSDCYPKSDKVMYIDATKPFIFKDNQFYYIFSEHMIEHISYQHGMQMLKECYRVLKSGGKLRVSTPDLSFLINLYRSNKYEIQNEYIQWITDNFIQNAPFYDETFVINIFMREWGHQFIYDEKILRYSFNAVGFKDVKVCLIHKSDDVNLCYLENESRMPAGFLRLESLILEGTK